jgi:hypothetical protein
VDRSPSVTLEPPSDDALRIFATQGTLWEAPRPVEEWRQEVHEEDDGEPASRQLPSDRTVLELPPPRRSDSDRPPPSPRPAVGLMTAPAAVPELRQAVPPADLTLLPMESAREAPDSLAEDRTLVMGAAHAPDATASGTFHGRATPAVDEPAPEASAPPAVVLMLTLALGLAIGGAGGYLLGQRSAARLQGPTTVALPPEEPRAPESAPGASERAAGDESSPRPAPTVPPPAAAAARQSPPPGRDGAAVAGELTVRSMPAKAGVIVNNVWRGRSPLTLRGLPLGTHTVRVVERGYSPETRRVVLDGRVPAATVSVQLARAEPERAAAAPAPTPGATTGSLYIESRPPGARVFVDGSLVGSTPLLLSGIKPGARDVRLEHPGHRAWTATVEITAGQRQRVAASLEEGS